MDLHNATRTDLAKLRDDTASRLSQVEAEIEGIKADLGARLSEVNSEAQRLRTTLGQAQSEIDRRERMDAIVPTITDHALLRYMERIHNIDVAALKADLLTDKLVSAIKAGATGFRTDEGSFVIQGASVVTFLGSEMRPKRKTRRGMSASDDDIGDEVRA